MAIGCARGVRFLELPSLQSLYTPNCLLEEGRDPGPFGVRSSLPELVRFARALALGCAGARRYNDRHCHIEPWENMKDNIRTLHSPVLTAVCSLMEDDCLTVVCPPMRIHIYTYTACL